MDRVLWQVLIRLSQINGPVRIGAILSETTHLLVFIELALLSLVVIVGDVQKFELHFDG